MFTTNAFNKKAIWFTALDWQHVTQAIGNNLEMYDQLSGIFKRIKAFNGVKEYIEMGLNTFKNYEKDVKVEQYNNPPPDIFNMLVYVDNQWVYRTDVPQSMKFMTNGFVSLAQKIAFKKYLISVNTRSLMKDLARYRHRTLLTQKIIKTLDNSIQSFSLDSDETFDDKWFVNNVINKENILKGLAKMRLKLLNLATPNDHTKFAKDRTDKEYIFSHRPKEMVLIWNTKYFNPLGDVKSALFNDNAVLLKVPKQLKIDFSSAQMTKGMSAAEKAIAARTIAFMVHKDALIEIVPEGEPPTYVLPTPAFKEVFGSMFMFGAARIPWFPIFRFLEKA